MVGHKRELTRRDLLKVGAAVGGGLLIGACAPGAAPSAAPSSAPAASAAGSAVASAAASVAPLAALQDASKKEGGALLWYIPGSPDLGAAGKAGFEKAYPWTKVTTFSASLKDLPNKIITEAVTGAPTADVFMLPATFRQTLLQNGIPTPVKIAADAGQPKDLLDPQEYGHPCYILLVTNQYNTDLVKTPPKDPFELADPSWKNKIAFDSVQNLGQSTIWLAVWRKKWGDAKWGQWLDGLKANNIFLTGSAGDSYSAVLRGERAIGIGSSNDVLAQKPGTPVAANYAYPPVRFIQYLWLTKKAAHPATAQLFIEWIGSEEGQKAVAQTGRSPSRDGIDSPVSAQKILPAGITPAPGSDLQDFYDHTDEYMSQLTKRWGG